MRDVVEVGYRVSTAIFCAVLAFAGAARAQQDVAAILNANQAATGSPPPGMVKITMTYAFAGMGLTGNYKSSEDLADGRFVNTLAAGPVKQVQGYDGRRAWLTDPSGATTEQEGGEQREAAISQAYQAANLWWRSDRGGARIAVQPAQRRDDVAYDVLAITPQGGRPFDAWFDVKTHLLARTVQQQGGQALSNVFSAYRAFQGVMQAQTVLAEDDSGSASAETLRLTSVEYSTTAPAAGFSPAANGRADFSITGGADETSTPFRLIDNRVYADVRLDGRGPFLFLFDTGATDSITTGLAQKLGLKTEGQTQERGAGEGASQAEFAKVPEIAIAGARIRDQLLEVAPDQLRSVEGLDDEGIIGFEVFHRFVTRIDYARGVITLIDPVHFDAADAGTPIHFVFEGNVIEVAGEFEGAPGRFIIDTGSRADVVLTKPFAQKNKLKAKHPKGVDVIAGWGTGGPSRGYATRGALLTIGPVKVRNLAAFLSSDDKGAFSQSEFSGEIGGGVLKRFVVTFDYEHQTMYLKPSLATVTPGAFDRAGMWFNRSIEGFEIVDVVAGSPVAQAGLKSGDQIVAVDGQPAKTLQVYELRRRFRDEPPGTRVAISFRRDGQSQTAEVTLRDLI